MANPYEINISPEEEIFKLEILPLAIKVLDQQNDEARRFTENSKANMDYSIHKGVPEGPDIRPFDKITDSSRTDVLTWVSVGFHVQGPGPNGAGDHGATYNVNVEDLQLNPLQLQAVETLWENTPKWH